MEDNIFITYAHTSIPHREDVIKLAEKLRADGVPVIMDEFLEYGESISKFMEQSIERCQKIIIICDQLYANKANERVGGVGSEIDMLSFKLENKKILPIVIKTDNKIKIPNIITAKKAMIVENLQNKYEEILNWCCDIPKKPELGKLPESIVAKKIEPNKLVVLSEKNYVGKFLLKTSKEIFLDLILALSIDEQRKVLYSLQHTYSQDTGYGGFENYAVIGRAMHNYIEKSTNKECSEIALNILDGCSKYRWELEDMLKEAEIKVLFI